MGSRALSVLTSAVSLLSLTLAPASAAKPAAATWLTAPRPIDGVLEEDLSPVLVFDSPAVSVTASNNGDWLYLAFASKDPAIARSILRRGLKLEISAKDGRPLTIGYPLAHNGPFRPPPGGAGANRQNNDMDSRSSENDQRGAPPPPGEEMPPRPEGERGIGPGSTNGDETFDLIGPGKDDIQHIAFTNNLGLTLRTEVTQKSFVYEIQVPLTRTEATPYAVGAVPGDTITVTLKTREKVLPEQGPGGDRGQGPGDSGMSGGGPRGMGGGGMGGPGGMRGGGPPGMGGAGGGLSGGPGGMGGGPGGGQGGSPGGMGAERQRESSSGFTIKAKVVLAADPAANIGSAEPKTGAH